MSEKFRQKLKELGHTPGDFSDAYGLITICETCGAEIWENYYGQSGHFKEIMIINEKLVLKLLSCTEATIKDIIE